MGDRHPAITSVFEVRASAEMRDAADAAVLDPWGEMKAGGAAGLVIGTLVVAAAIGLAGHPTSSSPTQAVMAPATPTSSPDRSPAMPTPAGIAMPGHRQGSRARYRWASPTSSSPTSSGREECGEWPVGHSTVSSDRLVVAADDGGRGSHAPGDRRRLLREADHRLGYESRNGTLGVLVRAVRVEESAREVRIDEDLALALAGQEVHVRLEARVVDGLDERDQRLSFVGHESAQVHEVADVLMVARLRDHHTAVRVADENDRADRPSWPSSKPRWPLRQAPRWGATMA